MPTTPSYLRKLAFFLPLLTPTIAHAQQYRNPILFSDYSDPDVLCDGKYFYLVASTFEFSPGLPILRSTDLVHWTILTHALPTLTMDPKYNLQGGNRYGRGVWAPALRKHNNTFFLFFPTPDEGIFVTTAKQLAGPWTPPVAVLAGPNLEDPCPFWDDDGTAWLVHSRTGAGPLILHQMSPDGTRLLDDGKVIVQDREHLPTLEGPKLYKRNGWYYIFAPFGGVSTGAQVTLRSRSIGGPYEQQVSLHQGSSAINGPHQGGWVTAPDGRDWFVHFQSRGAHGRIVHLEPMRWQNDWPVMGTAALDPNATRPGQPVATGPLPATGSADLRPQTSDEFTGKTLGQQWEWNHNPDATRWSLTARPGFLRLTATPAESIFAARNTLTQQMQNRAFDYTVRLDLNRLASDTHAGLAIFEQKPSGIEITTDAHGVASLRYFHRAMAKDGTLSDLTPADQPTQPLNGTKVLQLRVHIDGDTAAYSYSTDDGAHFQPLGPATTPIDFSWWKGARPAVFHFNAAGTGTLDLDWAHYQPAAE